MDSGSGVTGRHGPGDDGPGHDDAGGRRPDASERPDSRGLLEQLSRHAASRYELGDELGQGATGIVRAAHDGLLRRGVALKRLRSPWDEASGSGSVGRLVRFVEQALGRARAVGPWSDVYAVGAMLYHLLAGRPPYLVRGERLTARLLVERVVAGPPAPLEQLAADVPAPLAAITTKAMAREPRDRYAHMGELREDLLAYLEGRVVRAHRTGAAAELGSWVRRNRGTAAALALVVVLALGGTGALAWVQSRAADEQRRLADDLALERTAALTARDAEARARRDAEAQRRRQLELLERRQP